VFLSKVKLYGIVAIGLLLLAVAMLGIDEVNAEDHKVKIGVLHSLRGTMAISETSLKDVALMAVEEINAAGGIMGKQIEPAVVDPASDWDLFAEKAKDLISKEEVAVVFGCWTSVSRRSSPIRA
jgi:urea transport system substrate-binding protein